MAGRREVLISVGNLHTEKRMLLASGRQGVDQRTESSLARRSWRGALAGRSASPERDACLGAAADRSTPNFWDTREFRKRGSMPLSPACFGAPHSKVVSAGMLAC